MRKPFKGKHFSVEQTNDFYVTSNKELSNNFTVLKIDINHVDQLILRKPVHIRRSLIRSNDWKEESINLKKLRMMKLTVGEASLCSYHPLFINSNVYK